MKYPVTIDKKLYHVYPQIRPGLEGLLDTSREAFERYALARDMETWII